MSLPRQWRIALLLPVVACSAPPGDEPAAAADRMVDTTRPFLVVVNKSSSTLSVIAPVAREEIAEIPTGHAPHEVATSGDGRFAYVTDYGTAARPGHTITIVDLAALQPAGTIELGEYTRPHGIALDADGMLWVTTEGSGHVVRVDPAQRRIVRAVPTNQSVTHMVVVSDSFGRVYTANIGSGTVTAVDAASGDVLAQIPTGAGAEGIDVSEDGATVYVTNREAGTLVEIDVATNRVVRELAVGDFPIRVEVREGGGQVLVSNARGDEVVGVDVAEWRVVQRIPVGTTPVGILVNPDDRHAYVANTADDRITIIDLIQWQVDGHLLAGDEPDGMAWAH